MPKGKGTYGNKMGRPKKSKKIKVKKVKKKIKQMPIPNHCFECDKPVRGDEWLCYNCQQKEI